MILLKCGETNEANGWQSFLNDSKGLFQIVSQCNVACVTAVQLSMAAKNHVRYLDYDLLSSAKQIAEVYEEIFLFRDIWDDEYSGQLNDIHPFTYTKDKEGKYTNKTNISVSEEDDKQYKLFFHVKSRNDANNQVVLYEMKGAWNKWREVGKCRPGRNNK